MNVTHEIQVTSIPVIGKAESGRLLAAEYEQTLSTLEGLQAADWFKPTDCSRWQVRDIASHLVGTAEAIASVREAAHQLRLGRRAMRELGAAHIVHGSNEVQVRDRRHLATDELIRRLRTAAPRAMRKRSRTRLQRMIPMPFEPPLGRRSIGYYYDRVWTRDLWMHRVDICRATGAPLHLTGSHDGRIIADLIADWAGTHQVAFTLILTGPAGGTYVRGVAQPTMVDAVDCIRVLSGRATGQGILAHPFPL